jgi:hypothetical protein
MEFKELAQTMAYNLPISEDDAVYILNRILMNPFDLDYEINAKKHFENQLEKTQNILESYGRSINEDRDKYMNKIKFYQGERSAYEKILNYYDNKLNEGE